MVCRVVECRPAVFHPEWEDQGTGPLWYSIWLREKTACFSLLGSYIKPVGGVASYAVLHQYTQFLEDISRITKLLCIQGQGIEPGMSIEPQFLESQWQLAYQRAWNLLV